MTRGPKREHVESMVMTCVYKPYRYSQPPNLPKRQILREKNAELKKSDTWNNTGIFSKSTKGGHPVYQEAQYTQLESQTPWWPPAAGGR